MGRDLLDLLLEKKVDIVVSGHDHLYARSHQLATTNGGDCDAFVLGGYDENCVADADDAFVAGDGTVLATAGTGGFVNYSVRTTDPERDYYAAAGPEGSDVLEGFLKLSITANQLSGQYVVANGTMSDAFTIAP